MKTLFALAFSLLAALILTLPSAHAGVPLDTGIVVSVADQELAFINRGKLIARFPVSTRNSGAAMASAPTARRSARCISAARLATACPPARSSKAVRPPAK